MRTFSYTVTEYDQARIGVIVATHRGTVELAQAHDFTAWAAEEWPGDRYKAQLDLGKSPQLI
jgi:hypothetical protein